MTSNGFDSSTGFLDRASCLRLTALRIAGAEATEGSLAAFWINLDRFSQVNASCGHRGGDQVIAQIANRLRACIGSHADLARMGGDEFVCLLRNQAEAVAIQLAETMRQAISVPIHLGELVLHPAASIGLAHWSPRDDAFGLLQRADRAMAQAKREGGNRVLLSGEPPMMPGALSEVARIELEIENKLRIALDHGGLQLHYQPVIADDGRVETVEALMRCRVGDEMLSPAQFIPVAEKTGLIVRLGEWTLTEGALFARRLHQAGMSIKVAVNVSRAQLLAPRFAQALYGALICGDIAAGQLELELTESLFMDMSATVQDNLRAAREAGVGLAIDDFGTGYSCLANLKDLPATKLKLDRSFVCVLPQDCRALAIVKSMTRLGQELGMAVVAEGVETPAQEAALRRAQVDLVQGYLHAAAMPGDTLIDWLMARAATSPAQPCHD